MMNKLLKRTFLIAGLIAVRCPAYAESQSIDAAAKPKTDTLTLFTPESGGAVLIRLASVE